MRIPAGLTYRQAHENGWQVRRGEQGTQVEFWQFPDRAGKPGSEAKPEPMRLIHLPSIHLSAKCCIDPSFERRQKVISVDRSTSNTREGFQVTSGHFNLPNDTTALDPKRAVTMLQSVRQPSIVDCKHKTTPRRRSRKDRVGANRQWDPSRAKEAGGRPLAWNAGKLHPSR